MEIDLIVGTRPNFVKMATILHAINQFNRTREIFSYRLIHTGQHYDHALSGSFFEQLDIPSPDVNLEVGSGTQAEQTAGIMLAYEKLLLKTYSPTICLVVGDVTSTMACTLVAKKLNIKVAHVEAGIRSGDLSMPEKINRLVTDCLSNYFFTITQWASDNLIKSGIQAHKIELVGNTMIDTLLRHENRLFQPSCWSEYALRTKKYIVLTLHRPSNVDSPEQLEKILRIIENNSVGIPVIFPIHPRTKEKIKTLNLALGAIKPINPLSYLEFNYLVKNSGLVITDSGGITEEATLFRVPCITLRTTTERPETVEIGTNELIGDKLDKISSYIHLAFNRKWKSSSIPSFWDGQAAERIIQFLYDRLEP
ncbi:UDP-N-acetylglucosamine 2-epimerase (non-hydrolyzing) [Cytophagales bacterium LB-30]|uniref:UDP-N-acetylglucosamine 2-epimerase (Non-hydrolyzing) n=1 Tax=Shiella aurantiaca TaxID=3058365 RepID=A0ABT8F307_9BACT|nr:UDP-N-acetylglucosamine 2-epimerase (non-hydrolyzing) [Shiella aurantiaca]MDN4164619.1 UDP-N-acetylglucosamine 2-epimerase (non-hydrolyzing) [Shiella aurantiaca]